MARRRRASRSRRGRRGRRSPPRPRSQRLTLTFLLLLTLALLAIADRRGWLLVPQADESTYHNARTHIERIVDGDTLIVPIPDARERTASTRVRLWGIDAPELARPFESPPLPAEPLAEQAAAFAREATADLEVMLLLEAHRPRDRYGRLLAHVVLPDGRLLAELLVEAGLARADDRWPHRYLERLDQLETRAKRARIGLWAE